MTMTRTDQKRIALARSLLEDALDALRAVPAVDASPAADIRRWGHENGYDVSATGCLKKELRAAYAAAQE